jgi:hypothetical protein
MPVIINEFEIITDQRPERPKESQVVQAQAPMAPYLGPQEIEQIQRRHYWRMERVWAD